MKYAANTLDNPILDLDGQPVKIKIAKDSEGDLTVRHAIRLALTASTQDREKASDDSGKLFELFELTRKVYTAPNASELELTAQEIITIQQRAAKVWGVEVFGYLHQFLEGKLAP